MRSKKGTKLSNGQIWVRAITFCRKVSSKGRFDHTSNKNVLITLQNTDLKNLDEAIGTGRNTKLR